MCHKGHEYYYIVHGHAGVPHGMVKKQFKLPTINLKFYCKRGGTTAEASINADWQKLMNRLRVGSTQPDEHVKEATRVNEPCDHLFVLSGDDVPQNGIYFCCRDGVGKPPHANEKLQTIGNITEVITAIDCDAKRRGLSGPIIVHWIACRYHFPAPAGVAAAGVSSSSTASASVPADDAMDDLIDRFSKLKISG